MTAAEYSRIPKSNTAKSASASRPTRGGPRRASSTSRLFGADFAYTVDGGMEGELEYENFNAASAKIDIQGRNVHPGYAKDKMINAIG